MQLFRGINESLIIIEPFYIGIIPIPAFHHDDHRVKNHMVEMVLFLLKTANQTTPWGMIIAGDAAMQAFVVVLVWKAVWKISWGNSRRNGDGE